MRVLCVSRHQFLSEHLSRYFGALGAECESVVGLAPVAGAAARFEPHVMVAEGELLVPAIIDAWSRDAALADVPVLAVSLTRRPEPVIGLSGTAVAGVIYLPALDESQARALLEGAYRPRGVPSPSVGFVAPGGGSLPAPIPA